jgi:hypothetical protein
MWRRRRGGTMVSFLLKLHKTIIESSKFAKFVGNIFN